MKNIIVKSLAVFGALRLLVVIVDREGTKNLFQHNKDVLNARYQQ